MLRAEARPLNRPHVEKLRVQNFGRIRDAEIQLTPLHALIGPNDSGKSTVLRALRTLCWWAGNMTAAPEESYQAMVSTLRASLPSGTPRNQASWRRCYAR